MSEPRTHIHLSVRCGERKFKAEHLLYYWIPVSRETVLMLGSQLAVIRGIHYDVSGAVLDVYADCVDVPESRIEEFRLKLTEQDWEILSWDYRWDFDPRFDPDPI